MSDTGPVGGSFVVISGSPTMWRPINPIRW